VTKFNCFDFWSEILLELWFGNRSAVKSNYSLNSLLLRRNKWFQRFCYRSKFQNQNNSRIRAKIRLILKSEKKVIHFHSHNWLSSCFSSSLLVREPSYDYVPIACPTITTRAPVIAAPTPRLVVEENYGPVEL
jgi:hypothetical protein